MPNEFFVRCDCRFRRNSGAVSRNLQEADDGKCVGIVLAVFVRCCLKSLPKEEYKGFVLPIGYTTDEYYDVAVNREETGFTVEILKKRFDSPVTHTPEEYDFPDRLYAPHWEGAQAYGVFEDGELLGAIELWPEGWSNRLRITELWVKQGYRRQGIGKMLMDVAKENMKNFNHRALMLETQSCNVNAVDFYIHQGFTLIGFDACCYANNDLSRKEVRLERWGTSKTLYKAVITPVVTFDISFNIRILSMKYRLIQPHRGREGYVQHI